MSEAGPSNLRVPKATYRNHNGFTEPIDVKMSGLGLAQSSHLNLHAIAANAKNAKLEELRELHDAVQRRQPPSASDPPFWPAGEPGLMESPRAPQCQPASPAGAHTRKRTGGGLAAGRGGCGGPSSSKLARRDALGQH